MKKLAGKKWWIIGGVVAVAVIVAVILLLLPKQKDIPDFGLKAGMSPEKVISAMEKKGMKCEYKESDSPLVFSGDKTLFGKKPSAVAVWPDNDHITVEYIFCGKEYTDDYYPNVYHPAKRYDDLQELFDELRTSADKKLGSPDKVYGYQADWNKDGNLYSLYRDSSQTYIEFYTQIR